MKSINLSIATLACTMVLACALGATGGALVGYGKGYKQGDGNGVHQASRAGMATMADLMTRGVAIKQSDGGVKTYVLSPVESAKQ